MNYLQHAIRRGASLVNARTLARHGYTVLVFEPDETTDQDYATVQVNRGAYSEMHPNIVYQGTHDGYVTWTLGFCEGLEPLLRGITDVRGITDDEAHDIAIIDALGPLGQG
jgi:hypothetical protein